MAQWLRVLATLSEDQDLSRSSHTAAHKTPVPEDAKASHGFDGHCIHNFKKRGIGGWDVHSGLLYVHRPAWATQRSCFGGFVLFCDTGFLCITSDVLELAL